SSVTQIKVQTGLVLDGNDNVTIDLSGGNPIPDGGVTVDGGAAGHDSLTISGLPDVVVDSSKISTGSYSFKYSVTRMEELRVAPNDVGPATIRVDGSPVGVGELTLEGAFGAMADVFDIESLAPNTAVTIDGGDGDDRIYLSFIAANLDRI